MRPRAIAVIVLILFIMSFLSFNTTASGSDVEIHITDPPGDTGSNGPSIYVPEIDILNVSVHAKKSNNVLGNITITITTVSDGYGLFVVKFGDEILFFNKTLHTTVIHINRTVNASSIPGFSVACMRINGTTIYYDYAIYAKEPSGERVVIERPVRVYPSLWNVFGVTFVLSFSTTALLGGMAIGLLGNRKEKIHSLVPVSMGLLGLGTFFYVQFILKQNTIFGILNWSEVPILQSVVAIVSSAAGVVGAAIIILAIVIVNQKR